MDEYSSHLYLLEQYSKMSKMTIGDDERDFYLKAKQKQEQASVKLKRPF